MGGDFTGKEQNFSVGRQLGKSGSFVLFYFIFFTVLSQSVLTNVKNLYVLNYFIFFIRFNVQNGDIPDNNNKIPGIYALAAKDIFDLLRSQQYAHLDLKVSCSFFEIYGGSVFVKSYHIPSPVM